ncbi:hypothetical protein D2E26_0413 [Bifidobacterium dolichotidis]|uniref:Uncharacterized protein n=1 Tax=Bifidobacterium dolichotidis TaxID=2306976 RepID=A0A430FSM3_9BIFI|nr:hypothetical protein [Bifidobacterium dolichotidis]RSX55850.1 hypothetical protein D2E26_0413 [Bifidobacterium dolichotidis]
MKWSISKMVCAASLVPAMLMSMAVGSASANVENNLNDEAQLEVTNPVDVDAQASVSNGSTVEIKPQRITWSNTADGTAYGEATEEFLWQPDVGGVYKIAMTTGPEVYYRRIIRTGPSYHKVSVNVVYIGAMQPKRVTVRPWFSREYKNGSWFPVFLRKGYTPKDFGKDIVVQDLYGYKFYDNLGSSYKEISSAEVSFTPENSRHFSLPPEYAYTVDFSNFGWYYGQNPRNNIAIDVITARGEKVTGKFSIQLP